MNEQMSTRQSSTSREPGEGIRLAVVSDSVAPWNTGGKEVRHHELLTRLAARGFRVEVYTMHWWEGPTRIERDGITYVALCRHYPLYAGERRSIVQALAFALATFGMLFRRYDVVEVDAIPFLPLFPMRLVTWARRRPMVVTWHEFWGAGYWSQYLGVTGWVASRIEAASLRLPDRIIAASEGTGQRLVEGTTHPIDVRVVPNGVAPHTVRPRDRQAHALVAAGRLLDNKRMDQALDALAVLRDRGRPQRLLLIGEGPERARLHEQALRLGLGDLVEFSPFLEHHDDVLDIIAAASVLVFPSVREGFGMVALEAMSVGTPVVTSDHADNFARHLVDHGVNGALCGSTPESLADAVELCLEHGLEMKAAALATAAEYDWDLLASQAGQAYSA